MTEGLVAQTEIEKKPTETPAESAPDWVKESDVKEAEAEIAKENGESEDKAEPKKEEAKAEEKPEEKKQTMVPHAALHEERIRRQTAQAEARQAKELVAKMEQRFAQFQQQAQQPRIQPPDPNDPIAVAVWNSHIAATTAQRTEQQIEQQRQEQARRDQVNQVYSWVQGAEQKFAAEAPDYYEAINHLHSTEVKKRLALGLSEEVAIADVTRERDRLLHHAMQIGADPAQLAYNYALAAGYTKKAPEQAKVSPVEKLETIEKGQKAAKGLGGEEATGKLTLEALANLPDDEFVKLTKGDNWRKLISAA